MPLLKDKSDPGTESGMTDEEDFGVLLLDPSLELRMTLEEVVFAELLLWMTVLEEDEGFFVEEEDEDLPLLDPFDFADEELLLDPSLELRMTVLAEDEDSSSFTDVLLSSPQAVRHNAMAKSMDPIVLRTPG